MFVIIRGGSAWLCSTARSVYDSRAIQIRLQGEVKNFEVFKQRLDGYECLSVGVIKVYKCSNADKCSECDKCKDCQWRKIALETAQASAKWTEWVEDNGGYLL